MSPDSDPNHDPPATQADVILAVGVLVAAMLFCSLSDGCRSRRQYDNLRERLERIEQKVQQ